MLLFWEMSLRRAKESKLNEKGEGESMQPVASHEMSIRKCPFGPKSCYNTKILVLARHVMSFLS